MQPLVVDPHGTVRFKANAIVRHMLECCRAGHKTDLNDMVAMPFSQDDWEQFNQLIGYSLKGFHELSMVSDETALAASAEARKINVKFGGCRDEGVECEIHCGVKRQ